MAKKTAATVATKWAQRMAQATTAYKEGVQAVTVSPGQAAARAVDTWASNVQNAKAKFARNVAAVSTADWQQATITKGATRLASGATAAQGKFQTVMGALLSYQQAGIGSLPARGNLEANIARSAAWQRYMAGFVKPAGS